MCTAGRRTLAPVRCEPPHSARRVAGDFTQLQAAHATMARWCRGACSRHALMLAAVVTASVCVAVVMASIPIGGLHNLDRPHSMWLWVQFQ